MKQRLICLVGLGALVMLCISVMGCMEPKILTQEEKIQEQEREASRKAEKIQEQEREASRKAESVDFVQCIEECGAEVAGKYDCPACDYARGDSSTFGACWARSGCGAAVTDICIGRCQDKVRGSW